MCGIYGSTIKYDNVQVRKKLERTSFRGPDKTDWRFYNGRNSLIFGHNRLSIIDLDPRSDQPFNYLDKIHVVFNGEIYNFKQIRKNLEQKGYGFSTTSDTEVICSAYLEYGRDCVDHFIGMFSFVIYDVKKQLLFGARDRMGQKPFYYYHNGRDFEFSSQVSSIQLFNQGLTVSRKAVDSYLTWGAVPDPMSIFNEVRKLKAGHAFSFDLDSGKFDTYPYWDLDQHDRLEFRGSYEEAQNTLVKLLKDAVSLRLYADVPVGVFLSGGIDSSLVTAMAVQTTASKVKTFSVKFDEDGFDESSYAQRVASHLETDHHVIQCNYDEGLDLIENFSYYYDEPFADSSAIPSMLLSKYTRQHVTVALSGDGGDESFMGYDRYLWASKGGKIYVLPLVLRKLIGALTGISPNYRHKTIARAMTYENVNSAYVAGMTGLDLNWFQPRNDPRVVEELKYLDNSRRNLYERLSDFDLKTYMNWDINTKVDRGSMAFSLEARSPLMDHRVVEFARSLPAGFKIKKSNTKRILKDVLYQSVPAEIFDRPKSGFTMPFAQWFRNELKEYVLDQLSPSGLESIPSVKPEMITKMIDQHMNQQWNRYSLIWRLLVLKQWMKNNANGLSMN